MKVLERNVMRLVAVQELRTAYGIKTKNWNKNKALSTKSTSNQAKVFGVSLDSLPCYNMECGSVPGFLVDSCMKLQAHVDTEGLFRKSGSVVRLKALRAKLEVGEECLSSALPCDVAGLVKQFFRELPEPVLPTELQDAFLKAQQLPTDQDRTAATMLLTCVLPDKNICVLHYFFDFLRNVSLRSAENKMNSSNLSVILAPNLLHFGEGAEKMNANTEKRLRLQAAIVQCFIENADNFGVLPDFLQEKVPAMMGYEGGVLTPTHDSEELDLNFGTKRKHRRSFGVFSSATHVIATPSSKRKPPLESAHSLGFSNKKRRSVKKNLGLELLSNTLFSGNSTPASAYSASGVLDSSSSSVLSAGRSRRQTAASGSRKSKRRSGRNVINRVESGRSGCFSPKVSKKEAPRKSMRLRFSLGKNSKDSGSKSIGLRLAKQESNTSFHFAEPTEFSPSVYSRKAESQSSKYISRSEDNLLTPKCDPRLNRTPWSGDTPVGVKAFSEGSFTDTPMRACLKSTYVSEPTVTASKLPAGNNLPMTLCCAASAESLDGGSSTETLRQSLSPVLKTVCGQSSADVQTVELDSDSLPNAPNETSVKALTVAFKTPNLPSKQSFVADEQSFTLGQIEFAALTPLHIDSVVFDSSLHYSPDGGSVVDSLETEREQIDCSRLIDALDIQSPARFKHHVSSGPQSTPYKPGVETKDDRFPPTRPGFVVSLLHERSGISKPVQNQQAVSPQKARVADHIQHFNKLTLYSPPGSKTKQIRSPLKFQRTPVRQTVCRINSLLGDSRRPRNNAVFGVGQSPRVAKTVSLESGLSPHPQPQQRRPQTRLLNSRTTAKNPPAVPPKKLATLDRIPKSCALGDVTNKAQQKTKVESSASTPSEAQKLLLQQVTEKDTPHYRGSPKNPLNQGNLLSAMKPIDL
ncbi:rho GTPase-activating protein 11A isoform X1 [Oryzias latipes]|nr:rho GTPase-activating protein 11A isoform X1 [Oryzias latipes]XP_020569335.1 rho GTPase-activating protein 11A isoform X1 [Oryzias latipes]